MAGRSGDLVAEDVRVAADHLGGDRLDDVGEGERAVLLGELRVIDDLEEEVAQLVAKIAHVVPRDRVGDLVGFLDRVRRDGREVLFQIPRAAGHGRPQRRHDFDQA